MTQKNRTYLKSKFETKDVPTQTDFADGFDSEFNLTDDSLDDIPDGSTYIKSENNFTDAEKTLLANQSGVNTGDETASSIAAINHGAAAKTTLVDADEITGQDSADSFSLIRTTWVNVKAFLKTYTDTLYAATLGADENYVTNAEKTVIGNTSGSNTGDQDLSGLATKEELKTVVGINEQTGTTYTLALADAGKLVRCSNAGAIALTVPLDSVVAFPVNTVITIEQQGAGVITVAGSGGVTVNAFGGFNSAGQFSGLSLIKVATDTWTQFGGVA